MISYYVRVYIVQGFLVFLSQKNVFLPQNPEPRYTCLEDSGGIFEGKMDASFVAGLKSWKNLNAARLYAVQCSIQEKHSHIHVLLVILEQSYRVPL